MNAFEPNTVVLHVHGRRVRYVQAGSGPVLVLIHGVVRTFVSETQAARWDVGQWRPRMTSVVKGVDAPTAVLSGSADRR